MALKDKLQKYIIKKQEQIQKGKAVTEQMKAERKRKRLQKMKYAEPGTITFGLHYKQNPIDFMKDSYERRKLNRESKKKTGKD